MVGLGCLGLVVLPWVGLPWAELAYFRLDWVILGWVGSYWLVPGFVAFGGSCGLSWVCWLMLHFIGCIGCVALSWVVLGWTRGEHFQPFQDPLASGLIPAQLAQLRRGA